MKCDCPKLQNDSCENPSVLLFSNNNSVQLIFPCWTILSFELRKTSSIPASSKPTNFEDIFFFLICSFNGGYNSSSTGVLKEFCAGLYIGEWYKIYTAISRLGWQGFYHPFEDIMYVFRTPVVYESFQTWISRMGVNHFWFILSSSELRFGISIQYLSTLSLSLTNSIKDLWPSAFLFLIAMEKYDV